jgi:hypothetical protein
VFSPLIDPLSIMARITICPSEGSFAVELRYNPRLLYSDPSTSDPLSRPVETWVTGLDEWSRDASWLAVSGRTDRR